MRQLALSILFFLTACHSQDSLLQDANGLRHPGTASQFGDTLQFNNTDAPVRQMKSIGEATEQLVIRWSRSVQPNPFSTIPVYYEIWHNENHIDTVATNSYLLILDKKIAEAEPGFGCIRLRAIRGEEQSEFSEPMCFKITT